MKLKELSNNVWLLALLIGIGGGFCAVIYHHFMMGSLHFFWEKLYGVSWREIFSTEHVSYKLLLITTLGGLLVGISNKFLGTPGEIAAVIDNIHLRYGRLRLRETPSMIVNSLISIGAGGSAGPEAPLVQIIGSLSSKLGDKLSLNDEKVRICTLCGMACALGAFFGAPLGGALFALEIPHRKSVEYAEAIFPTMIASTAGFLIYRGFVGYHGPIFNLASLENFVISDFFYTAGLAMAGSVVGAFFIYFFRFFKKIAHPFEKFPVIAGIIAGLGIGLVALVAPQTLFWGEWQAVDAIRFALEFTPGQLVLIILAKMVTIAITLHFGFRGGFIFPLFFIGAMLGILVHHFFPFIPYPLAILSLMAALNISATKTPLATIVILTSLTGTNVIPHLAIAAVVSLVCTHKISFIHTQQTRPLTNGPG